MFSQLDSNLKILEVRHRSFNLPCPFYMTLVSQMWAQGVRRHEVLFIVRKKSTKTLNTGKTCSQNICSYLLKNIVLIHRIKTRFCIPLRLKISFQCILDWDNVLREAFWETFKVKSTFSIEIKSLIMKFNKHQNNEKKCCIHLSI